MHSVRSPVLSAQVEREIFVHGTFQQLFNYFYHLSHIHTNHSFMYKEGQRASTMTIAFGGTDQKMDWLKFNLQITKRRFNSASTGVTTGSIPEYAYHNGDWNQAKYQYFHKGFAVRVVLSLSLSLRTTKSTFLLGLR